MLVLRTLMRVLLPLLMVLSLYLLLGSFEGVGGGFGSGLLAAGAIILHMMISGSARPRQTLTLSYIVLAASGILFAMVWGSVNLLVNQPFLSARWFDNPIPGIGSLGIPVFLNIGAYMVVVGVTTQIALLLLEEAAAGSSQPSPDGADQLARSTTAHNGQGHLSRPRPRNQKGRVL
jgi:multicomponent Na+:H+ antiporter subunit B